MKNLMLILLTMTTVACAPDVKKADEKNPAGTSTGTQCLPKGQENHMFPSGTTTLANVFQCPLGNGQCHRVWVDVADQSHYDADTSTNACD